MVLLLSRRAVGSGAVSAHGHVRCGVHGRGTGTMVRGMYGLSSALSLPGRALDCCSVGSRPGTRQLQQTAERWNCCVACGLARTECLRRSAAAADSTSAQRLCAAASDKWIRTDLDRSRTARKAKRTQLGWLASFTLLLLTRLAALPSLLHSLRSAYSTGPTHCELCRGAVCTSSFA